MSETAAAKKTPGSTGSPPRVLLCKSGLEEHDRGVRYVTRSLREAGMEVIYIVFHDPAEIGAVAVQEDVDVVGLSSSAGGHVAVTQIVRDDLVAHHATDIRLILGGIIPAQDHGRLKELGVEAVFGPGSRTDDIVQAIQRVSSERRTETK